MQAVINLMGSSQTHVSERGNVKLALPKEFREFRDVTSFQPYKRYLLRRGYTKAQVFDDLKQLGLLYCTVGPFGGRVIFPVREKGVLASWTGRSVHRDAFLRYKSLSYKSSEQCGVLALGPISDYLLWFDDLNKCEHDTICLVEGPFDALKVRVLGGGVGVTSTCFFTQSPSKRQVDLLHMILPKFRRRFLVLDRNTVHVSMRLSGELSSLDVAPLFLPNGVKDPGDLRQSDFNELLENAC
jgi:hypothetical protein